MNPSRKRVRDNASRSVSPIPALQAGANTALRRVAGNTTLPSSFIGGKERAARLAAGKTSRNSAVTSYASSSTRGSKAEEALLDAIAHSRCELLKSNVAKARRELEWMNRSLEGTKDAVEAMITDHERRMSTIREEMLQDEKLHRQTLHGLANQEQRCIMKRERCLEEEKGMCERVMGIQNEKAVMQELIGLEESKRELKREEHQTATRFSEALKEVVASAARELVMMEDDSYGLSGEVKEVVLDMKRVSEETRAIQEEAMRLEVTRRELFSACESLKGSIRVYGRVNGRSQAAQPRPSVSSSRASEGDGEATPSSHRSTQGDVAPPSVSSARQAAEPELKRANIPSRFASTSSRVVGGKPVTTSRVASTSSARGLGRAVRTPSQSTPQQTPRSSVEDDAEAGKLYSFSPAARDMERQGIQEVDASCLPIRSIAVHQTRHNATSTGTNAFSESFTFDHMFDASSSQEDVYEKVEPLILNALDGYSICIFAYGQTGSGKTFSMEGDISEPRLRGITPRAMATIFDRAAMLREEGWHYEYRCSVIEIYNDTILDLLQSPSIYASGGPAHQQSNYHTIQHHHDTQRTTVTHVKEERIHNYADFQKLYSQAVKNRKTSSTVLNSRSSRSHCICVLHLDGENDIIRQRSRGTLCLVDLAGSERVNESGVKGNQLKEAININRSLLDLGKCINAMRSNEVVPWRNCRLTHFLQLYLGAKGGKMMMLVAISEKREHVAESVNSLRFAARVADTYVGPSVKRVTKM